MKRSQALADGILLEVDSVIANEPRLKKNMVVDSCAFEMAMFEDLIDVDLPNEHNAYTETVRLLQRFLDSCDQAPDETTVWCFKHDSFKRESELVWRRDKWICKVTASIEDGLRCLTFTQDKG